MKGLFYCFPGFFIVLSIFIKQCFKLHFKSFISFTVFFVYTVQRGERSKFIDLYFTVSECPKIDIGKFIRCKKIMITIQNERRIITTLNNFSQLTLGYLRNISRNIYLLGWFNSAHNLIKYP